MRSKLVATVITAVLWQDAVLATGGVEHWQQLSTTAMSITGDIDLSPTMLRTDAGPSFALRVVADIPGFAPRKGASPARILEIRRPSNPTMMNGNKLCGRDPVRWIAVYRIDGGKGLMMEVFSGRQMPRTTNDPGFCGGFSYVR